LVHDPPVSDGYVYQLFCFSKGLVDDSTTSMFLCLDV
jgi:hypothetical protein